MKEYEIFINNKVAGKVKTYNENNKEELVNSLIVSKEKSTFEILNDKDFQTYEIEYIVDNEDDLFNVVSKYIYDNNKIFDEIEKIKKYNNINIIKKSTKIKVVVSEIYLEKLNISKSNVDLNSLFLSKTYFVKEVLNKLKDTELIKRFNNIINDYNSYNESIEYEFLTDEEKNINTNKFIKNIDELIGYLEKSTNYKYGKDYIIPINISNN